MISREERDQPPIANGNNREKSLNLKETKYSELQNEISADWLSPWSVAAANAITILNSAGYDFRKQDLSNISIPGAILSHGTFEGTNFANSNLKGVDFSDSCLVDADLFHANMLDVNFGEVPCLRLKGEIAGISYSPKGRYLAVDTREQTILFESSADGISFHLKEVRRFPGKFTPKIRQPFSKDERKIVTFTESQQKRKELVIQLQIWDIISEQLLRKLELPIGKMDVFHFSPDLKEFVSSQDGKFQQCDVNSENSFQYCLYTMQLRNLSSYRFNEKLFLIGATDSGMRLYNLVTGKPIYKQKQGSSEVRVSSHCYQLANLSYPNELAFITDYIRGNILKSLSLRKFSYNDFSTGWSFGLDGRSIVTPQGASNLCIQDIAYPEDLIKPFHSESHYTSKNYSLRADGKQIAFVGNASTISFFNFLPIQQNAPLKGIYNKGLSLKGANISGSRGLSDKNIRIFRDKGDYLDFDDEVIKKYFLCSSTESENRQELSLVDAKFTKLKGQVIEKEPGCANLRKLDLSENSIGDAAGRTIAINKTWTNLEELLLNSTNIGSKTISGLIRNETWKNLKKLHLRANKINDSHAEMLANCKIWKNLEDIDLSHNEISAIGAEALGNNSSWIQLKNLNLNTNEIKSVGAKKIIQNTTWKNLQLLDLGYNSIDASGLKSLCQNKILNKLIKLDLESNPLCAEGALLLSQITSWANIKVLNLYNLALGNRGIEELSKSEVWSNLKTLNLGKNSIFVEGAKGLRKNTTWKNLEALILVSNGLGNQGVRELSKNSSWVSLKKRDLGDNFITGEGAIELSQNTAWVNLQTLILTKNKITEEQVNSLKYNPTWKLLENLEC